MGPWDHVIGRQGIVRAAWQPAHVANGIGILEDAPTLGPVLWAIASSRWRAADPITHTLARQSARLAPPALARPSRAWSTACRAARAVTLLTEQRGHPRKLPIGGRDQK